MENSGAGNGNANTKIGDEIMGDKGKKDKGGREQKKKSKLDPKEKRRIKKEKKQGKGLTPTE